MAAEHLTLNVRLSYRKRRGSGRRCTTCGDHCYLTEWAVYCSLPQTQPLRVRWLRFCDGCYTCLLPRKD